MNKRNKVKKIGKKASHRRNLISTQLSTLFEFGKLKTTTAKAKVVKGYAESLIAKVNEMKDEVAVIRLLKRKLYGKKAAENALKYIKKSDAKVTIARIGFRSGDNAEVSELELVDYEKVFSKKKSAKTSKTKATSEKK